MRHVESLGSGFLGLFCVTKEGKLTHVNGSLGFRFLSLLDLGLQLLLSGCCGAWFKLLDSSSETQPRASRRRPGRRLAANIGVLMII